MDVLLLPTLETIWRNKMDLMPEKILIKREKLKDLSKETLKYIVDNFNEHQINLKPKISVTSMGQLENIGRFHSVYLNDNLDIVMRFEPLTEDFHNSFLQWEYNIIALSFGEINLPIYSDLKFKTLSPVVFSPSELNVVFVKGEFKKDPVLINIGKNGGESVEFPDVVDPLMRKECIIELKSARLSLLVDRNDKEYLALEDVHNSTCKAITSDRIFIKQLKDICVINKGN